jgi:hypothetical protein
MLKPWLMVSGAACLLAAGAAWFGPRAHERPLGGGPASGESAGPTGQPTTAELTGELAALRQRLSRLEQGEAARGQRVGSGLRADAEADAQRAARKQLADKLKKYSSPELDNKMFAGYFTTLDGVRRAEGVDLAWARDMDAFVRQGAAGNGAPASLAVQAVDCGRTLCRIELTVAEGAPKQAALAAFIMKVGPQLPQGSVHAPVGSNQVTAYFARSGTDLPPMESPEHLVADLP